MMHREARLIIFAGFILTWVLCTFSTTLLSTEKCKDNVFERQVKLQKIMEIKETDESFYFRFPGSVYADTDENVYVLDYNRLLKFSRTGVFIKDLIKTGQGPGEVTTISSIQLTDDKIIIHNNNPSKIIWIDKDGSLKKEFRLEKNDWIFFSHFYEDNYYFRHSRIPAGKSSETYIDVDHKFIRVSADGKEQGMVYNFPIKTYIIRVEGAAGTFNIADLITSVYEGRYLFLYHTPEYKIKCIDITGDKVINEFGVDYERQEISEEKFKEINRGIITLNGKRYKKPVQKYFNDIRNLLVYKNVLWVVTSTVDKEKGIRVDVYDFKGKNIDRFFLFLPDHYDLYSVKWFIIGDFLYSIETPEGLDPKVIKYKIDIN